MSRHARALAATVAIAGTVAGGCGGGANPDEATRLTAGAPETTRPPAPTAEPADPTAWPELTYTLERARAHPRPSRSRPPRRPAPKPAPPTAASQPTQPGWLAVQATAYCLTGTMANGRRAHAGAVAANRWPLGTVLELDGYGRRTVEDRIGHSSQLDLAMPGNCPAAIAFGRRTIRVRVIG